MKTENLLLLAIGGFVLFLLMKRRAPPPTGISSQTANQNMPPPNGGTNGNDVAIAITSTVGDIVGDIAKAFSNSSSTTQTGPSTL